MGCSISKELETPIKTSKEALDAMLSQSLAVQKNSGLKSSDRGYIAAIFSANYGTMRMDSASVKSVDSKALVQGLKPSGNSHQHKVRKEGGGDQSGDGNQRLAGTENLRKSWPDLRVGLPKFSSEDEAEVAKRATDDCMVGEPETINTWELMQGLDDDDGSPTVESKNAAAFSEDPAASDSSKNHQTSSNISNTPSLPRKEDSIAMPTEKSSWIPENLQRALSFKYIFSNQDQDGSLAARSGMDSKSDFVSATTRSMEGEGPSSPSSPEFSAAASLKDWLPESGASPQKMEPASPHLPNSKRLRSTINKYGGGLDDQIAANATTEPNKSSNENSEKPVFDLEKSEKKSEKPVFDTDLVESFEKAMEQLSQEEWYAVRNMEVSSANPKEIVQLVNSLRSDANAPKTTKKAQTNAAITALKSNKMVETDAVSSDNIINNNKQLLTGGRKSPIRPKNLSGEENEKRGSDESVVVLYSTTWQGNLKVFEDCNAVRMILRSVGASFDERNIHEHPEYEQQLKQNISTPIIVPTLWVKGRCMAGADNILQLYKKGILGSLLREAIPGSKAPCICRGGKFLICPLCKGRGRLVRLGEIASSCRHCSGTGLIKCTNCSSS